ncbi:MAG: type II toxin-antitoxin system HicB family antitoxin [Sutterella sp.]|nr:type II toxin-antitoxin system HicB family antitoxin [Sutterella sp.]
MRYPVAVWVENGIYSAEVPDLPGVITEADSLEELEKMVVEAASGWMECELDDGRAIPEPSKIENHLTNENYQDCMWMLVDVDMTKLSDKVERLNICLPSRALRRLDSLAAKAGESRSGFLAKTIYSLA